MNIKVRLTLLNFLEFAVWGAYLTSMGSFLANIGLGSDIGLFYSVQGFVSLIMPALMGIVADRFIQAQKVLSLCHLLAGTFMLLASFYCINSESVMKIYHLFSTYSQKANKSFISSFLPSSSVTSPLHKPYI